MLTPNRVRTGVLVIHGGLVVFLRLGRGKRTDNTDSSIDQPSSF